MFRMTKSRVDEAMALADIPNSHTGFLPISIGFTTISYPGFDTGASPRLLHTVTDLDDKACACAYARVVSRYRS